MTVSPDNGVGLAKTMIARRTGLRTRLAFSSIYALAFGPIAGWTFAAAWLGLYVCLQLVELRLFDPARIRVYGVKTPAAMAMLAVNNLLYGALAPAAMLHSGVWGLACGALFLAGGVLNAALSNQRSLPGYLASVAPFVLYLLLLAGMAWNMSGVPTVAGALGAVGLLMFLAASSLWKTGFAGLRAQTDARMEAERRRLEAEASAEAKSAFVATVSHELRTPISAILAGTEAIERNPNADPAIRANAALISEAGEMMRTLLNDLLDLSKMEAGRMAIETIDFDIETLVARTVAFWQAEAARRGLALRCEGWQDMPQWMAGDPTRLRQILNNLFSNAIKFTEAGEIVLRVKPEQRGPYWLMRFSVTDTGRGMSPAQLDRLFKPFEQTQVSTARTHGGTGLGLAISRELARLMGGDLEVVSREGEGSTFTLEIGLVEADHGEVRPEPAEDMEETSILVVDDHEMNRRAVGLMLEPFGVKLSSAASGEAALEMLATTAFDVVLMDVYMPGMDGREACRRLRALAGPNQHVPVIACTASTEAKDLKDCFEAGMNGYVAKPIDAAALHAAIAEALSAMDTAQNEAPRPAAEALA